MKRLLSILLSVMLLLGSISITAFAEDTLVLTRHSTNETTHTYALVDSYVVFTAIDGATYYNGDAVATLGPVLVDGTVSLKVNAGQNVFTARKGDAVSNGVSVYGATVSGTRSSGVAASNKLTDATATIQGYITAYEEAAAQGEVTDETILANYALAKKLLEYDETNKTYGRDNISVSNLTSNKYGNSSSPDYVLWETSFFIDGAAGSKTNIGHLYDTNGSYNFQATLSTSNEITMDASKSGNSITVAITPNEWHKIFVARDPNTEHVDAYIDDVLVFRGGVMDDFGDGGKQYVVFPKSSANVYYSDPEYAISTSSLNVVNMSVDAITEVAGEDNQVTVTGTGIDGSTIGVFVGDETATSGTGTMADGTATVTISSTTANENASVYAAVVDSNGNILNGLYGALDIDPITMSLVKNAEEEEVVEPVEPLELALTTDDSYLEYTANGAADNVVIAGSKVLFNEIELLSGSTSTVKYYNNDVEVPTTAGPIANTVAITVNEGVNTITAKRADSTGAVVDGTESNAVVLVGKAFSSDQGSIANKGTRYTEITDEAVLSTLHSYSNTVYQCTGGNVINGTEHGDFFTDIVYDYAKMDIDVYYTLVDGKINGTTGNLIVIGVTSARNSSGVNTYLYINDNGSIDIGATNPSTAIKTSTQAFAEAGKWNNFEFCVKDNGLIDIYMNDVLIIKNFLREDLGSTPYTTGLYFRTANATVSNAYNNVYFGNIDLGLCWYPIKANLSTGSVKIPVSNYTNKIANNEEVAVLGRKADGTVDVVKYTHTGAETTQELPGTSYEKIFVWKWDDLTPLCDAIQ